MMEPPPDPDRNLKRIQKAMGVTNKIAQLALKRKMSPTRVYKKELEEKQAVSNEL